jgi:hypothetical protein
MENTLTRDVRILPTKLRLLNATLRRVKHVAVSAILPVIIDGDTGREVQALKVRLEGSSQALSELNRLLDQADLKVS